MRKALYISIIIALLSYAADKLWFVSYDMVLMMTEGDVVTDCGEVNDLGL